jgi:hypothetical protein
LGLTFVGSGGGGLFLAGAGCEFGALAFCGFALLSEGFAASGGGLLLAIGVFGVAGGLFLGGLLAGEGFAAGIFELGLTFGGCCCCGLFVAGASGEIGALTIDGFALLFRGALAFGG